MVVPDAGIGTGNPALCLHRGVGAGDGKFPLLRPRGAEETAPEEVTMDVRQDLPGKGLAAA